MSYQYAKMNVCRLLSTMHSVMRAYIDGLRALVHLVESTDLANISDAVGNLRKSRSCARISYVARDHSQRFSGTARRLE